MLVDHFHEYGTWISNWTRVRLALANLHQDSPLILRHGYWPQSHVDVPTLEARLWGDGEVCEFNEDGHYIGPTCNCPPPSFHVAIDCHEGYMLILSLGDVTYAKLVWVARDSSQPNSVNYSPYFQHIQVEYYQPTTRNKDMIHQYTGWGIICDFHWRVDFKHGSS